MRTRLVDAVLWAVVLVGVALILAAGGRIVNWIVGGGSTVLVWKNALLIVGVATGTGAALARLTAGIGNTEPEDDEGG